MAETKMTISGHLDELRLRLIYSAIAFGVVMGICLYFQEDILNIVVRPYLKATNNAALHPIELTDRLLVYFKSCLIAALALSGPFILYQLWQFIGAGLYPREKKYVILYFPVSIVFFVLGVFFCYYVFLPPLLQLLASYGKAGFLINNFSLSSYFDIFIMLILILGLVFELPLVMLFFVQIGLVTPKFYWQKLKVGILLAFILAAIITPTGDPLNQTFLAVPLILLYILGIILSYLFAKVKKTNKAIERI